MQLPSCPTPHSLQRRVSRVSVTRARSTQVAGGQIMELAEATGSEASGTLEVAAALLQV